jgi:hypothetical protein
METRQEQFRRVLSHLFQERRGKRKEYVKALLKEFLTGDPVDVNQNYGYTHPLIAAIHANRKLVFRWLLRHPQTVIPSNSPILLMACQIWRNKTIYHLAIRPEINLDYERYGLTALDRACFENNYEVAVSLIAAGGLPRRHADHKYAQTATMTLVDQYAVAPILTRQRCQLARGDPAISAACLFGLAISIDDYWRCCTKETYNSPNELARWMKTRRFFTMVQRVPTELQMLICRRVYGLNGFNIPSSHLVFPTALLLVASGEYTWA